MSKPKRKHPGFDHLTESGQGVLTLRLMEAILGGIDYMPLAYLDGVHVFALGGVKDDALFLDATEEPSGEGRFRHHSAFAHQITPDAAVLLLEYAGERWDAWAYAQQTGDDHWIQVPRAKMYAERDRRNAELAEADTLHLSFAGDDVLGVPLAHLLLLFAEAEELRAASTE